MIDVFGLGNAIVDTEVDVDDTFLRDQEIAKGHMTLIDSSRMQDLLGALDGRTLRRCSGGSAANTTYAVQAFGHRTSYGCKVSDDEAGRFFLTRKALNDVSSAVAERQRHFLSRLVFEVVRNDDTIGRIVA